MDLVTARSKLTPDARLLRAASSLADRAPGLINSSILIRRDGRRPRYAISSRSRSACQARPAAITSGLAALGAGFGVTIAATLVFGLIIRASGTTPGPFLAGLRPVADFINSPDVFSVIVSVLAGIVGVVSLTEAKASTLIGVFISVTTIPAAASIGISIAYGLWREAGGSTLQLLLNVVVLIVVGDIALTAQRRIWRRQPTTSGRV